MTVTQKHDTINLENKRKEVFKVMKIYIVTQVCDEEYGNTQNVGVFDTREEAEKYLNENVQQYEAWFMDEGETRPDMYIEEWEVNGKQIS